MLPSAGMPSRCFDVSETRFPIAGEDIAKVVRRVLLVGMAAQADLGAMFDRRDPLSIGDGGGGSDVHSCIHACFDDLTSATSSPRQTETWLDLESLIEACRASHILQSNCFKLPQRHINAY